MKRKMGEWVPSLWPLLSRGHPVDSLSLRLVNRRLMLVFPSLKECHRVACLNKPLVFECRHME